MNFALTDEETLVKQTVRDMVAAEHDSGTVRAVEASDERWSTALWRSLADHGLCGIGIPEEHGGAGGTLAMAALAMDELGHGLARTPLAGSLCVARVLLAAGYTDPVPGLAAGDRLGVVAAAQGVGRDVPSPAALVPFGVPATDVVVVAGGDVFLLSRDSASIDAEAVNMLDGGPYAWLQLPSQDGGLLRIGALSELAEPLAIRDALDAAELTGGARGALDLTLEYVKERRQFDRPIGSFQVLQHRLADLATEVDAAQLLAREAAWSLDEGLPARGLARSARQLAADVFQRSGYEAVQMAGGYGYMQEYDMQLYFRRAEAGRVVLGPTVSELLDEEEPDWARRV